MRISVRIAGAALAAGMMATIGAGCAGQVATSHEAPPPRALRPAGSVEELTPAMAPAGGGMKPAEAEQLREA